MAADREHPVLSGLGALVGVTLVVGLVFGLSALVATNYVGIGEGSVAGSDTGAGDTLYLPPPPKTTGPTGPAITLAPTGEESSGEKSSKAAAEKDRKKKQQKRKEPKKQISLSASPLRVGPMERIYLSGVYQGGEGAILQVQRFEDGSWSQFPVTVSVSGGTFSTYVQTGREGKNRFRVRDTDSERVSNEVTITVG